MVDLAVRFSGQTLAGRPRSPPPTRRRLASPLLPGAASSSASPRRLHLLRRHCVVPVPGCLRLRLPLAQGAAVSASSTAVAVNVAEHRLRRPRSATVPPCRTKSRCICLFLPLALPPRPPRCAVAVAEQGLQGGRGESEEVSAPLLFPSRFSYVCEERCLVAVVAVVPLAGTALSPLPVESSSPTRPLPPLHRMG
ncbi:hypothetical protein DAI22_11g239450 [Oryza sativa Japonica Group]|nr:hypothetical protein DAI22_11g239450 [Oryza sativa Japonica Group]